MSEKKISVGIKPMSKKLGKGYELQIVATKPKHGNISWIATVKNKDGETIAAFNKPLERNKYLTSIQNKVFPINDNGVQATYKNWRTEVEKLIEVKISWQPTGREMFKLNI
jgi:hypothetical protein